MTKIQLIILTSVLNKMHNANYYYRVREAQAACVLRVGCIPEEFNLSDLFIKTTIPGNKRHNLVALIFSNIESLIGVIEKL